MPKLSIAAILAAISLSTMAPATINSPTSVVCGPGEVCDYYSPFTGRCLHCRKSIGARFDAPQNGSMVMLANREW